MPRTNPKRWRILSGCVAALLIGLSATTVEAAPSVAGEWAATGVWTIQPGVPYTRTAVNTIVLNPVLGQCSTYNDLSFDGSLGGTAVHLPGGLYVADTALIHLDVETGHSAGYCNVAQDGAWMLGKFWPVFSSTDGATLVCSLELAYQRDGTVVQTWDALGGHSVCTDSNGTVYSNTNAQLTGTVVPLTFDTNSITQFAFAGSLTLVG